MVERDEDGRPIATRNAGAFMGPFTGIAPVPSDLLDRHWRAVPRKSGRSRRFKVTVFVITAIILAIVFIILAATTPSTVSGLPPLAFA